MLFMIIFWVILFIGLLIYLVLRRTFPRRIESITIIIILLAWSFLIVAIVQKDPIFSNFGVPPELEWVVGLFITALSSWKLYFDPIKQRMIRTEKEVVSIKTDVSAIKSDVSLIKDNLINKKR